jgi:REP element-mobilizing transposase RayT
MSHTFSNLLFHVIFGAKNRAPEIIPEIKPRLLAYLGGIVREIGGEALIIGGTVNHVHLLVRLSATLSVADAMRIIKTNSSRWVHETWPMRKTFAWQSGYASFSVSLSNRDAVTEYIARQEEHHKRLTFTQELIAFLTKHGIPYDERYICD